MLKLLNDLGIRVSFPKGGSSRFTKWQVCGNAECSQGYPQTEQMLTHHFLSVGIFFECAFFWALVGCCNPREMAIFWLPEENEQEVWMGSTTRWHCADIAEQAALGAAVFYALQLLLNFYHWLISGTGSCVIPSSWVSSYECRRCCGQ